ncbi:Carbonic anhydrase or acetyltransferase, isoleucine patch superfamily [Desulfotomaculum arcticum]|uniref:Carbonic anhydrase or acetyltransferase, isoleucine patch superfamily n=1 Tax=Desulfotruncus arcticus DSM 17038 TaxID=1121424 RepID=A0A1I2ZPK1_9FIRM|nr:carbonate dehydratase [Desulfotruncus arcticus]SFH39011.1 Carbonic anhydrase or acetyltransferase, isoleucine patch superfamily [Desulfotomaculum arcticum] [Desulfotruncus arcticus DSM 17038]
MRKKEKILLCMVVVTALLSILILSGFSDTNAGASEGPQNIRPNVIASFNAEVDTPEISPESFIDPQSAVIGNVHIGKGVYVAPFASVRGDEGQRIWVGDETNIQDGVILHALETEENGEVVEKNLMEVNGNKYAVYIGDHVSLAHQCQVHGPAVVGNHTFVGMQAFVFKARVGDNVVIEPAAKIIGVSIPDGRYVPAGEIIKTQDAADNLPEITDSYVFKDLNAGVLHVNEQLAEGYLKDSE